MRDDAMFEPLAIGDGATASACGVTRSKPVPIVPVPEDAPPCTWRHPKHGAPVAMWPYHDAERRLVGYAARVEFVGEDGKLGKSVLPITYCHIGGQRCAWRACALPSPRTLYRLPELITDPAAPVIVTEGEKKADAVPSLFPGHVGTTSMGGAGAAKHSDWSPLTSRRVIIWPDHDEPGRRYADDVARLATAAGAASVTIVPVPVEWPEGWDIADALPEGAAPDALAVLLQSAIPWTPTPPDEPRSEVAEGASTGASERDKPPPQAKVLLDLAHDGCTLFHAPDQTAYADVWVNGHRETYGVRDKGFRFWLTRRYYENRQGAPSNEALQSALTVLEAQARFDGLERAVYVRIADADGKLYLDLADTDWRAIEIDATGWRIIPNPPVRFRRPKGMLSLLAPERGGTVDILRQFVNVRHDADFVLIVAWLLAAFRASGPYPVLALSGEHGSAKSTLVRLLRQLIDPHTTALRSLPREDRDLFIAASNAWMLPFDNVSTLPNWLSDSLCRLATGGGFATRALYTNGEEALFDAMRPVVLNGIEDYVTRPDLADRVVAVTLAAIPDEERRTERKIFGDFAPERPKLLGALLDAVARGLRELPTVKLPAMPRMADFAEWGVACESALPWATGTLWTAYTSNRDAVIEATIEADAVATAIVAFMESQNAWNGTATTLLGALGDITNEATRRLRTWPSSARALGGRLRRAAPGLRKIGIHVDFERDTGRERNREIHLSKSATAESAGKAPSEASEPSASAEKASRTNGHAPDDMSDGDGQPSASSSAANSAGINGTARASDCSDDSDAGIPHLSGAVSDGNELDERAAIIAEGCGVSRTEAERRARVELGISEAAP